MTSCQRYCAVPSCTAQDRRNAERLSYHRFPTGVLGQQWIAIIREIQRRPDWEPKKCSEVCSLHFSDTSFLIGGKKYRKLISGSLPDLKLSKPEKPDDSKASQEADTIHCPDCNKAFQVHVNSEGIIVPNFSPARIGEPIMRKFGAISRKRLFQEVFDETEVQVTSMNSSVASSCTDDDSSRYEVQDCKSVTSSEHEEDATTEPTASSSSITITPRSRKRVRLEHSYADSPGKAAQELKGTKRALEILRQKYKNLQQKFKRIGKSKASLQDKLIEQNSLSSNQLSCLSQEFPDLLQRMVSNEKSALSVKGKTGHHYDDEIKKFSATLHFYSPKAYKFVREFFTLPHPHTISSWMKSSNCGPGYNIDVMNRLAEVRKLDTQNILSDVVMMIDEMAIRKELVWNASAHCYEGHIDYGTSDIEAQADLPLASNVLVCMIAGISGGWKVPIGYIYTDKTDSEVQMTFVNKAFLLLDQAGFNVHALISDGNTANVSLFQHYGVIENPVAKTPGGCILYSDIVSVFTNPANAQKSVHAVYDVCHMLKLWRNMLPQCGEIKMSDGRVVNWQFLVRLYLLQEKEKVRAANKLGRNHIEFGNHKMNVRLAAQSISKSNADALVFCREELKLQEFQGSDGTTYFLFLLDKVFDILNSRSPAQKTHKSPLNCRNLNYQTVILKEFCSVVLNMTYVEVRHFKATKNRPSKITEIVKNLAQSARKRACIGFVVSIKSILEVSYHLLYRDLNPMRYVMTYRFSQDLLELFFNKVRGRLGRNNNPSTVEFRHFMKSVWHQNLLKSCNTGNCVEQMGESVIPGGLLPLQRNRISKVIPLELEDIGNFESLDLSSFTDPQYSVFYKNCLAYIAGNVVRIVGTKLRCEICAEGMLDIESDALNIAYRKLIIVKDRGGLFVPCQSVYNLVELSDRCFRQLVKESAGSLKLAELDHKIYKVVMEKSLERPTFPHMHHHFVDFDPLMSTSHLQILVKGIVLHFLKIRLFDYGKRFQKTKEISTRHTLTKVTLFKNQ